MGSRRFLAKDVRKYVDVHSGMSNNLPGFTTMAHIDQDFAEFVVLDESGLDVYNEHGLRSIVNVGKCRSLPHMRKTFVRLPRSHLVLLLSMMTSVPYKVDKTSAEPVSTTDTVTLWQWRMIYSNVQDTRCVVKL